MKKIYSLTLAVGLVAVAGSAMALGNTGSAFGGTGCGGEQSQIAGFRFCTTTINSGTTAAQLGKQTIYPSKAVSIVVGVSGSAVANVVSPTISYYLGNKVIATQTVSASTAGNVVATSVPYFNAVSISMTQPTLISATNGIVLSIIENDK